jgi:hypothetical protein
MGSEGLLDGDWKNVSNHDLAYAFCESCVLGKGRRLNTYPALERAQRPNDLVHIDIGDQQEHLRSGEIDIS